MLKNCQRDSTTQSHKRQVWLQILAPIIFIALVALGLIILAIVTATGSAATTGLIASISLMIILLPLMLISVVVVVLLVFVNIGLVKLINILPFYSLKFQTHFYSVITALMRLASSITMPIINTKSQVSGFSTGLKKTSSK